MSTRASPRNEVLRRVRLSANSHSAAPAVHPLCRRPSYPPYGVTAWPPQHAFACLCGWHDTAGPGTPKHVRCWFRGEEGEANLCTPASVAAAGKSDSGDGSTAPGGGGWSSRPRPPLERAAWRGQRSVPPCGGTVDQGPVKEPDKTGASGPTSMQGSILAIWTPLLPRASPEPHKSTVRASAVGPRASGLARKPDTSDRSCLPCLVRRAGTQAQLAVARAAAGCRKRGWWTA